MPNNVSFPSDKILLVTASPGEGLAAEIKSSLRGIDWQEVPQLEASHLSSARAVLVLLSVDNLPFPWAKLWQSGVQPWCFVGPDQALLEVCGQLSGKRVEAIPHHYSKLTLLLVQHWLQRVLKKDFELDHRTLDAINEAIFETDLQGSVLDWNQAAMNLFGWKAQEAVGRPVDELCTSQGPSLLTADVVSRLLREGGCQIERPLRRRDGSSFPAHLGITLIGNPEQQAARIIFTCRDITVRMEALKRSREASQRLAFHVEQTPLACIEFDRTGQIVRWNAAAERIFGYAASEIIGQSYQTIIRASFKEGCAEIFDQLRKGQGGERSTNENVTKDGRTIICEWYNTLLLNDHGQATGFASLVDDITDRVRADEELKTSRTEAEEANRSKDDFLALMNHEMRTPLNSIIGFTDLLRDGEPDQEKRETLDIVDHNARHLLKLISDVIDYTRLDSNRMFLEMRECDLELLHHELEEAISVLAAEKGLLLNIEMAPRLPTQIFTDYVELRHLLYNLLDNAIKFTDKGSVCLKTEAVHRPDARDDLWVFRFSVTDTGVGVPEHMQEKIFETFRQAAEADTRLHSGTGLGLAICRKITGLLDGKLWHEPNPGGGSRFVCELPLTVITPERTTRNPFAEARPDALPYYAEFFPASVLVVAHTSHDRSDCIDLLHKMGYDPDFAVDMRMLSQKLNDGAFNLVLMDLEVPERVLRQAHDLIRKVQPNAITAITAHASASRKAPYAPHTFDAILDKPYKALQLQNLLRRASQNQLMHPQESSERS